MDSPAQLDSASRYAASDRVRLLKSLSVHPGFVYYCERLREKITKELESKVWDVKTPDDQVRILRETRRRLTEDYSPEKVLSTLLAVAETDAEQEKSEKG